MLENQKIIVTGAASGIGKGIVNSCLQAGASVIACDLNRQGLQQLQKEQGYDSKLFLFPLDVINFAEAESFFSSVEKHHPDLTGLVNNAGIYFGKHILEYDPESISKVLDVNIKGYIYFTQFFGKLVFANQRSGSIINISSVSGQEGSSDAVYGCSKAAILGLTKSCALNFAPYIRVNTVAPTMVATPLSKMCTFLYTA
jgi:3-oxoacyl-[acyl-carrier protein] reductase